MWPDSPVKPFGANEGSGAFGLFWKVPLSSSDERQAPAVRAVRILGAIAAMAVARNLYRHTPFGGSDTHCGRLMLAIDQRFALDIFWMWRIGGGTNLEETWDADANSGSTSFRTGPSAA